MNGAREVCVHAAGQRVLSRMSALVEGVSTQEVFFGKQKRSPDTSINSGIITP